jgi:hypothetical protein
MLKIQKKYEKLWFYIPDFSSPVISKKKYTHIFSSFTYKHIHVISSGKPNGQVFGKINSHFYIRKCTTTHIYRYNITISSICLHTEDCFKIFLKNPYARLLINFFPQISFSIFRITNDQCLV